MWRRLVIFLCRKLEYILLFFLFINLFPKTIIGEGFNKPDYPSTDSEYFEQSRVLKVGFVPGSPPFQFIEDGKYLGFNIDSLNHIAQSQGLLFEFIPMSRDKGIKAIQDGSIDILSGVPFTNELSEKMEFSEAYVTSSVGVLVPIDSEIEDLSDLQEETVAIQLDTLEYEFLKNIRNVHMHIAYNQKIALEILTKKRATAFVGDYLTAEYLLEENNLDNDYHFIENYLLPLDYSLSVKKENYQLLHTLNSGIRQYKLTKEYTEIYSKWFGELETPLSKKLKKIREGLIIVVVIAVVIFLIGLRWNRQLQREVNRKTKDLQVTNKSLKEQMKIAKDSDQFKEQILESSVRGVITFDKKGFILTVNSATCRILHLEQSPVGKQISKVTFINDMLTGKIHNVMYDGKKYIGQEYKINNDQHGIQYIRYDIQPFYDATQSVIGVLLIFEDITHEKKMKDQLHDQEKSRALIQLVAGISHEIRNPLTSIKAFIEMMPYKMNSERFRNEISTHVPNEIDRLNQLVEGLVNYAKPKSEYKQILNISSIAQFIVLLFKKKIEYEGFEMQIDIEEDLYMKMDENQIKQVLINLILNSIESMSDKENKSELSLYLRLYSENNKIVIEIEDEGMGMTDEMIDYVFEPFYTTKTEGTGLGLAITKQFILENNGKLYLTSQLGVGTKFILRFPEEVSYDKNFNH